MKVGVYMRLKEIFNPAGVIQSAILGAIISALMTHYISNTDIWWNLLLVWFLEFVIACVYTIVKSRFTTKLELKDSIIAEKDRKINELDGLVNKTIILAEGKKGEFHEFLKKDILKKDLDKIVDNTFGVEAIVIHKFRIYTMDEKVHIVINEYLNSIAEHIDLNVISQLHYKFDADMFKKFLEIVDILKAYRPNNDNYDNMIENILNNFLDEADINSAEGVDILIVLLKILYSKTYGIDIGEIAFNRKVNLSTIGAILLTTEVTNKYNSVNNRKLNRAYTSVFEEKEGEKQIVTFITNIEGPRDCKKEAINKYFGR